MVVVIVGRPIDRGCDDHKKTRPLFSVSSCASPCWLRGWIVVYVSVAMTAVVWSSGGWGDWGMGTASSSVGVGELGGCGCRGSGYWYPYCITKLDCPVVATTWLLIEGLLFLVASKQKTIRPSARPLGVGRIVFFIIHLLMPGSVGVGQGGRPTGTDRALE